MEKILQYLNNENIEFHMEDDYCTSIPIFVGNKKEVMNIYTNNNAFQFVIVGKCTFNFIEGQSLSTEDMISDIKDILEKIQANTLQLVEHRFLSLKMYEIYPSDGIIPYESIGKSLLKTFTKGKSVGKISINSVSK